MISNNVHVPAKISYTKSSENVQRRPTGYIDAYILLFNELLVTLFIKVENNFNISFKLTQCSGTSLLLHHAVSFPS